MIKKTVQNTNNNIEDILNFKISIKCKNEKQKQFLNSLKDDKNIICVGTGSAGTGKSYISLSYALKAVKEQKFDKIIMIVPTAQATNKDMQFGYLQGSIEDKSQPFKDVDRFTIEKILKQSDNENYKQLASILINKGFIQYEFINFMLGKTFDNALILVNEAEQYTKEDMRLILTRLGDKSKIIITGDEKQANRTSIVNNKTICGLTYSANKLQDLEEVSIVEFQNEDIVRNPFITKIIECFE